MNDPGLQGPIDDNIHDAERRENKNYQEEADEEAEQDFLAPTRWWFASTAAPLIAGTFGPMSNAFNLLALIQTWRVHIPPGLEEPQQQDLTDPKWLVGLNAVSLVAALIANLALLLNMARRLPFSIAQPITIVGWYISSFILIGLVAAAPSRLKPPAVPTHIHSQAFYYAIISAALYFIIASLMMITVFGARRGQYSKEFKLTTSQRSLMLQTIGFLIYLLGGAAVFAKIEDWRYLDAVYWADVTLLTVGLGDFAPASHLGRSLLFPYAIGGILLVGLVIGSIRSLVLERGKKKMSARMIEKTRQKAIRRLDGETHTFWFSPFKKMDIGTNETRERERRKREFEVMREIQHRASTAQKWFSLGMSGLLWLSLWLVGAVVFWQAEGVQGSQGWSYFQSVYFAYVALLTVGYGDITPIENASKPFFVFWSLLAVPTLTILIGDMGDTIIKAIKDFTLWIGGWTVLPGEQGVKATLKQAANKATKGKLTAETMQDANPPGFLPSKDTAGSGAEQNGNDVEAVSGMVNQLEADEKKEGKDAREIGDFDASDEHHHNYLLMRELKRVMPHVHESPPRKYSYDEWAWFLKLLGEDEESPELHRDMSSKEDRENSPGDISTALQKGSGGEKTHPWSWIGEKSPLMGYQDEAEWVLESISATLERRLERGRAGQREKRAREKRDEQASTHSVRRSSGHQKSLSSVGNDERDR